MSSEIQELEKSWAEEKRWRGIQRPYRASDVLRLAGSVRIEHTLARLGAQKLWSAIEEENFVAALGAVTGNQAIQQVQAGLKAIYVSGWQVAADANEAMQMYPDQSLYPADSVPSLVRRISNSLLRADHIQHSAGQKEAAPSTPLRAMVRGNRTMDWLVPIVADAEAGFGGNLNAFELMKAMVEAGAAGVHFEDQLSSAKKCGHLGGKVLVPTQEFVSKLSAARLAADVSGVSTVLIARTDADSANFLTSDCDERDHAFILSRERTVEGFFRVRNGLEASIARALAYAPYADMLWCETSQPDLEEAKRFAQAVHKKFPGKLLAYNCSPSFNWKMHMDEAQATRFQKELGAMGYKFQFVTLAGFHSLNHSMFELATAYQKEGMAAYARLQDSEFSSEKHGYSATRHQEFVGTGYFDAVNAVLSGGKTSTLALAGSTEEKQFQSGPNEGKKPKTQAK